jgi:hypothetical protein
MPEASGPDGVGGVAAIFGLEQAADEARVLGREPALLRGKQERPRGEQQKGVQGASAATVP